MRRRTSSIALAVLLASGATDAQPAPSPGLTALAKSDYDAAEKELARATDPDSRLALARAYFEQGKYEGADTLAQAAIGGPKTERATAMRAEILAARGKVHDAITLLEPVARSPAKGADARRARLLLGQYLIDVGRRSDADAPLRSVVDEYNDGSVTSSDAEGLAHIGRAAHLLRSPKDANQAFNESERVDKKRVETLLWRAELFLDKYDPGHAEEVVKEALAIAPKRADALVTLARVKLEQALDFDAADKLVREALAVNPRHAAAFAVRAGLALRDMDIAGAERAIGEGLAANPNDLELLSLQASARFLDDDPRGFDAKKKEVLARNAQFSRMYGIVSEYAEWEHRYDDIVAMMKEATTLDPDDGRAWAELGLTEMRGGDEGAGLAAIRRAWSKDKFNVRVFNTLNMYEQQLPNQYELVADGVFKVRYGKEERAVMERYVPRMLGEAWASMKARYGYLPAVPVQIELYSSREQFSVRTSGLPNIGIQGVCFGRVVAAISPRAEPFNWGNVLWHELAHVFAIQLSNNHVPRWFTEGLSEYETIARRPEWARELDPQLFDAITKGRLPGAVDMNRAFTHASDAEDVTVAYYAASQMMVWTVERFGLGKVVRALELWGQGKKTPDVIKLAFGVSPDDYDKGFRQWALARMSRYEHQYLFTLKRKDVEEAKKDVQGRPNDPAAHVVLALAHLGSNKGVADAKKALDAAFAIDPRSADAHFVAAKLCAGQKDLAGAEKHLEAIRATGKRGYVVESLLADIAEEKKDKEKTRFHLEAAYRLDPSQPEPLKGLYDLAHEANREGDELDALRRLVQLEQHDGKAWRMLLEKLVAKKMWDEARKIGEGAVFVDVMGGATHVLYARALAATNAHDKASYELETALLTKMKDKETASAHALLAQELAALKKTQDAKRHLDEALALDPDNADAKGVKLP